MEYNGIWETFSNLAREGDKTNFIERDTQELSNDDGL